MSRKKGLTPKQERFVAEYQVDLNATQAAIRAGYSERTASAIGFENLSKPEIAERISVVRNRLAQKVEVTQERVLRELARVAFSDVRNLFTWDEDRACFIPSRDLTQDLRQAGRVGQARSAPRHVQGRVRQR